MYYNLDDLKGYAHLVRWRPDMCKDLDDSVVPDEVDKSAGDSLLSLVYALDKRTNLPTGDLNYLVSDKANPQVKQFILDNLMQDVSAAKDVVPPVGLSDDDIISLSRRNDESVDDYVLRLNESISRDKWMIDEYKKSFPSEPDGSSVSSE